MKLSRRGHASRNQSECSLSLSLSLSLSHARGQARSDINGRRKYVIFSRHRARPRAHYTYNMREDIFNRWPRERRGCFAMRDIDVQFTAGLGLLRSPQQRIRPRIDKPSRREEGMPMSLTRRLSRRYREPRASRDPEVAFRLVSRRLFAIASARDSNSTTLGGMTMAAAVRRLSISLPSGYRSSLRESSRASYRRASTPRRGTTESRRCTRPGRPGRSPNQRVNAWRRSCFVKCHRRGKRHRRENRRARASASASAPAKPNEPGRGIRSRAVERGEREAARRSNARGTEWGDARGERWTAGSRKPGASSHGTSRDGDRLGDLRLAPNRPNNVDARGGKKEGGGREEGEAGPR